MASMWSPEAVYIDDETGEKAVGHDAIAKQLDHEFAGAEDAKLKIHIDSIDFVSPNVAVEKGTAEVTYSKGQAGENPNTRPSTSSATANGCWTACRKLTSRNRRRRTTSI